MVARFEIAVACGLALGTSSCFGLGTFTCNDDSACVSGGVQGRCEPVGACSYPDDGCPSGRRYSAHAEGGLGGECLDGEATGTTTTDTTITGPSTTLDTSDESGRSETSNDGTTTEDDGATTTGEVLPCEQTLEQCWSFRYDEPAGASQQAWGIDVDAQGGFAVATSVATDAEFDDTSAVVLRFSADRTLSWEATPAATPNASDLARNVAFDDDGWLAAVGAQDDTSSAWIALYNPDGDGDVIATNSEPGSNTGWDVKFDESGDIVVVGAVGDGTGADGWLARYDRSGAKTWENIRPGDPLGDDSARGVAIGTDGLWYAVGSTYVTENDRNWWMRKYTGYPTAMMGWDWEDDYDNSGGWDIGRSVAVSPGGSGLFIGSSMQGVFVLEVGPMMERDGLEDAFSTSDAGAEGGEDIAVDGAGNTIVVGWVSFEGEGTNAFLRKYDPEGNTIQTRLINGDNGGNDRANAVAIGPGDMVFVAGFQIGDGGEPDVWVAAYAP